MKRLIFLAVCLTCILSVSALDMSNSKDWKDVYSVLLSSAQSDANAVFLKSEAFSEVRRLVPIGTAVNVYEADNAFIDDLANKMEGAGYTVTSNTQEDEFQFSLDPEVGRYIVLSEDNYRTAISVVPLAKELNAWVLFVGPDNVGEVVDRIEGADTVIGIGNFRRDVIAQIENLFTDRIQTNSIFGDSQEIAQRMGSFDRVILADGTALEVEFFNTELPVLVSGSNKILDETFDFLTDNQVKSVIIVGNQLAVVGDQIRSRSNREISVFIKFGQSDANDPGKLYALSLFPLPSDTLGLGIVDALYDPDSEQVIISFQNLGNVGLYALTTVTVKNGETEIGSESDEEVQFLGVGEILPLAYDISIADTDLTEQTFAELFTSYGASPQQLDVFLTQETQYGPPYRIPLGVKSLGDDQTVVTIEDVAYFSSLNRVGVTVANNGSTPAFYSVKINDLIVNGLEEDLFKEEERALAPGATRVTYIPVELDEVDIVENVEFQVSVRYGQQQDLLLKSVARNLPFVVTSGVNALLVGGVAIVVFIVIIAVLILVLGRKKKR